MVQRSFCKPDNNCCLYDYELRLNKRTNTHNSTWWAAPTPGSSSGTRPRRPTPRCASRRWAVGSAASRSRTATTTGTTVCQVSTKQINLLSIVYLIHVKCFIFWNVIPHANAYWGLFLFHAESARRPQTRRLCIESQNWGRTRRGILRKFNQWPKLRYLTIWFMSNGKSPFLKCYTACKCKLKLHGTRR